MDAVHHALEWIKSNDKVYDYVQYIFPTAPLRTSDDLLNGIETLLVNRADMVISVCKTDHPAQWMNTLPADKSLTGFVKPEYRNTNNQKLPQTYRINGAIYVAKWDIFYNKLDWMEQNTIAYIMPRERSVDIDTELDFRLAEVLMSMQDS